MSATDLAPGTVIHVHHALSPTGQYVFHTDMRRPLVQCMLIKRCVLDTIARAIKREPVKGMEEDIESLLDHIARLHVDFDDEETVCGSVSSAKSVTSASSSASTAFTPVDTEDERKRDAKLLKKKYRAMRREVIVTKVLRTITFDRYQRERRARQAAYAARMRA